MSEAAKTTAKRTGTFPLYSHIALLARPVREGTRSIFDKNDRSAEALKMEVGVEDKQKQICEKFGAVYQPCDLELKVGVSTNLKDGLLPINGLRIKEENGTSGWYIWTGEWSDAQDFFVPLHGEHLKVWAEIVIPYLGLPEGWRFLVADDCEDVWEDPSLMD